MNSNTSNQVVANSLEYYVDMINRYLTNPTTSQLELHNHHPVETSDMRLQYAIHYLQQALQKYPEAYELKILDHRIALKQGDTTKAKLIFDSIREKFPDHIPFKKYLAEITQSVLAKSRDDNFSFFLKIPTKTQREVFIRTAIYYESTGAFLESCQMFALVLKTYPETTTYYGAHAAQIAIRSENHHQPTSVLNPYRQCLVNGILPGILRNKMAVYPDKIPADIVVYQPELPVSSAPFISNSNDTAAQSSFHVTFDQLKLWLQCGQSFYIANKDWRKLFEVSLSVMDICNYVKLKSSPRTTLVDLFLDCRKLPDKLFKLLCQEKIINDLYASSFARTIAMACFVHCCYEFYEYVAGLKDKSSGGYVSFIDSYGQKTCLIPCCPNPHFESTEAIRIRVEKLKSSLIPKENEMSSDESTNKRVVKRRKLTNSSSSTSISSGMEATISEYSEDLANAHPKSEHSNFIEDDQFDESVANEAIILFERADECWNLIREMYPENTNLEQDLELQLKSWNLPLDVTNAVMLTRSELNLKNGGYLGISLNYFQDICGRFSDDTRYINSIRQQGKKPNNGEEDNMKINDTEFAIQNQTPLMLPLRVLYSIAIIYITVKMWGEARAELLIILAVMPYTTVLNEHFEKDEWLLTKIKNNFDNEQLKNRYKLIEVTQEGLVVRAIKDLIWSYEMELDANSSNSNDKEDIKLCQLIILSQYGWPYWRDRLFYPIILPRIKKRGALIYPRFLQFVSNVEIAEEIIKLYQNSPNLKLHLLPNNNSTSDSIKALETFIRRETVSSPSIDSLIEFSSYFGLSPIQLQPLLEWLNLIDMASKSFITRATPNNCASVIAFKLF
ncbi:9999_t:CDS:10 [Ambispora leptoticha]|uniref:Integrator complex subunit 10 n=1 Tax=Ambispora leptoticha TaxID=144679 RepID=A0A9N9AFC0_9GLOM|nr:9999_t:CDS:10 [Ambispora leptoticha]